jgi:hypothetical protein
VSSVDDAVIQLFIAFGRQRESDRARLFAEELRREISCGECCELSARNLMRSSKRMPELSELLAEAREVMNSGAHVPHIGAPQLAPRIETWWRTEAVKLIAPRVEGDRDLAAFVAAQMWFSDVPPDPERVSSELHDWPVWVLSAQTFTEGKDFPPLVEAAFRRARWASENLTGEMPLGLLNLEPEEAA